MKKFWNKKHPLGLILALFFMSHSLFLKLFDMVSTFLWAYSFKKFGRGSKILSCTEIRYPGNIELGNNSIIARGVSLTTEISTASLVIGDNSQLNQNVRIDFSGNVVVGSNVVISSDTHIYSHSHGYDPKSKPVGRPIIIEDNVWIGSGCCILDSVDCIGYGSIVAAGAIVTKSVERNSIVGGNPARLIKKISK